jgi:hypothetical protein
VSHAPSGGVCHSAGWAFGQEAAFRTIDTFASQGHA